MNKNKPLPRPSPVVPTETKFKKDDVVYERVNPSRRLIVGEFKGGLYYCRLPENKHRHFVYAERELMIYPGVPFKG